MSFLLNALGWLRQRKTLLMLQLSAKTTPGVRLLADTPSAQEAASPAIGLQIAGKHPEYGSTLMLFLLI